MRVALISCSLIVMAVGAGGCARSEAQPQPQAAAPPAVPVTVAAAVSKPMPLDASVVGTVEAYSTVSVRAQITGELTAVNFQQGDDVVAGQELFTLDRRPLEGALQQAQATLERDTAQAANAKAIMQRYEQLVERGIVAREQRDNARTSVAALEATLGVGSRGGRKREGAAAVRDHSRADLGPHRRADGERRQPRARQRSGAARHHQPGHADLRRRSRFPSRCCRSCAATWRAARCASRRGRRAARATSPSARITFIDNAVDQTTGTIKVKGTFPNADRQLWPGQFVNVVVRLTTESAATVVPSLAVQTGPDGSVRLHREGGSDRGVAARRRWRASPATKP